MSEDAIGYEQLTQDAFRGIVRAALQLAAGPRGLPGRHHFYITFRTKAPGVTIPEHLAARYPDEMTIVLEHQFWDLEVYQDRFRVVLKFGGEPHGVIVPLMAVTRFFDPSVKFGLHFEQPAAGGKAPLRVPEIEEEPPEVEAPAASAAAPSAVVSLDAFRKK
ncbi:MAG: stringent starvation protein B [Hyphomonadaceae bacterium]|nr:stringent starvation protein B [Hyphomonadaceae bacterium]